jgi:PBSX family phage terminase large subunit
MIQKHKNKWDNLGNDTRFFVITGGRGSGKSFEVGRFINLLSFEAGHKILFTRQTMNSAHLSIIPEFQEKIDLLELNEFFEVNRSEIRNTTSSSEIIFKGIKTSSGDQTANLKSLQGVTTWIVDEAEELTNEKIFNKINLSVRQKGVQNRVILILNPATKEHWIYKRFFEEANVEECFTGVKGNVTYIHSTYLDNLENLEDSFLQEVEYIKTHDIDRYNYEILGGWLTDTEGAVFTQKEIMRFAMSNLSKDNLEGKIGAIDVADEGEDALSFPIGYIIADKIYITDWLFTTENTEYTIPVSSQLTRHHKLDYLAIETNNHGSLFLKQVNQEVKGTGIIGVHQSTNKHSRIIQNAHFVRNYVVFRNDYEIGSDYDKAMKQMFNYTKDGKAEHDDAPDSIALLVALARDLYQSKWN